MEVPHSVLSTLLLGGCAMQRDMMTMPTLVSLWLGLVMAIGIFSASGEVDNSATC